MRRKVFALCQTLLALPIALFPYDSVGQVRQQKSPATEAARPSAIVNGAVVVARHVELSHGARLALVLALVGGMKPEAKGIIQVKRPDGTSKSYRWKEVFAVSAKAYRRGEEPERNCKSNPFVQAGDVITVF